MLPDLHFPGNIESQQPKFRKLRNGEPEFRSRLVYPLSFTKMLSPSTNKSAGIQPADFALE
jgi:hypothetical protein